jgi:hypothetical protein
MHHPCVLYNKTARIDAVQTEEGKDCGKGFLMPPMGQLENFLQTQLPLKKRTELARPVVEVSGDDQRPLRRHLLVNISRQFAGMLQPLAMGQSKVRADQGQHQAIIGLHIRMKYRPWLLFGRFRKSVIPPAHDRIAAQKTIALDTRGKFHCRSTDAMGEFLLQMIQKGMDHGILRNPYFLQHDNITLFPQYGLNEAFLDGFLPKGAKAQVQIIA